MTETSCEITIEPTYLEAMLKPVEVRALPGYKLWLRYEDGAHGEVDLSGLVGKGVFQVWNDPHAFEAVTIGESGELTWGDEVELCPDAMYMRITGKSPHEVFPILAADELHA